MGPHVVERRFCAEKHSHKFELAGKTWRAMCAKYTCTCTCNYIHIHITYTYTCTHIHLHIHLQIHILVTLHIGANNLSELMKIHSSQLYVQNAFTKILIKTAN